MDEERVAGILGQVSHRWADVQNTRILAGLTSLYESNEVLVDGRAPALQRCCPSAPECWAAAQHRLQDVTAASVGPGENASIFWPWVGNQYRPGGVCLVALNLNHATGGWWSIGAEYAIAGHAIDGLEAGRKNIWRGSSFHYRSMATALAAVTSMEGSDPTALPEPERAATAYHRVARVQAVKCVPLRTKSYPTARMMQACPPRFARHELGSLEPGVLIALGVEARKAVGLLGHITWHEHGEELRRGVVALDGGATAEVVSVPHPNSRGRRWPIGQTELVASLIAQPLRSAG